MLDNRGVIRELAGYNPNLKFCIILPDGKMVEVDESCFVDGKTFVGIVVPTIIQEDKAEPERPNEISEEAKESVKEEAKKGKKKADNQEETVAESESSSAEESDEAGNSDADAE